MSDPWTREMMRRATTIHSAIAADLEPFGGILRCGTCKTEQPLGDIAGHTRHGWPKCCGYTMRWVTQRQLDEESAPAAGGVAPQGFSMCEQCGGVAELPATVCGACFADPETAPVAAGTETTDA